LLTDAAERLASRREALPDVTGAAVGRVDQDEPEARVLGVKGHHARHAVRIVVGMRHDERQAESVGLGRASHGHSLPLVPLDRRPGRAVRWKMRSQRDREGGHS
jgi:hypothetical protein